MGKVAIHPSAALAQLIKERRQQMGLSLREVQAETEKAGTPIPYATLSKVEQGRVDPGVKRLHTLLRLYGLPVQLAADLLELEEHADHLPAKPHDLEQLREDGIRHWRQGRLREGLACLLALRQAQPDQKTSAEERHRALVSFAVAARGLGKVRMAHQIVENLLLEGPHPDVLVNVLVLGATCWHALGSPQAGLGFLLQAETHLERDDAQKRAWILHERSRILQSMNRLEEAASNAALALDAYYAAEDSFGACQATGSCIHLAFLRDDVKLALTLAVDAVEEAAELGYDRLRILRQVDVGRARVLAGDWDAGVTTLREALGEAVALDDHVLAFHGHHALWKAHLKQGDVARAEIELNSAIYYSRFVDQRSPDVVEVRRRDRPDRPARG